MGKQKGRLEQARAMLLRQMRRRFGKMPRQAIERVQKGALADIERWAERLVTAGTVSEVFMKRRGASR